MCNCKLLKYLSLEGLQLSDNILKWVFDVMADSIAEMEQIPAWSQVENMCLLIPPYFKLLTFSVHLQITVNISPQCESLFCMVDKY